MHQLCLDLSKENHLLKRLSAVLSMTVLAVTFSAGVAHATPPNSGGDEHVVRGTAEMRVTGFNEEVAHAHGYEIVTLKDGRQVSVPKAQAAAVASGRVTPRGSDTVWGNCGYSFIEFNGYASNKAHLRTGFGSLKLPADNFFWVVEIHGGGTQVKHWGSPLLADSSWSSPTETVNVVSGSASAEVDPGVSFAQLIDGEMCVAGNAWTFTNIP
jgi:hypothetical protein